MIAKLERAHKTISQIHNQIQNPNTIGTTNNEQTTTESQS